MADNNIFFVNGVETSSAAEVQTALDQATSGISISVWNGDIAFSGDHTSAGAINLNVGGTSDGTYEGGSTTNWCTEFQKDNTLSSTVTFNSDFKGTVSVFTGTNSENSSYADSTAENANMRLIFDGAEVTGGSFYNFNYGYIEFKNGAIFDNKNSTGHIRGDVLVTGEGTDVKIALERVYGDDFGADNIVTATLTVADGARFYDTVGDANVLNLGKTASNRQGKIIINGGTFQSRCTIAPATYGTISISNSTVNGKTYYGKMLFDSTAGNPTLNFSGAAANALTISVNSADYADLKESYKIIELADPDSTLDLSKVSITVDGAAYTLGTTFADRYSINQVENDLVLTYTPPPPLTVSANGGVFGQYDTLGAAITAINDDSGTGPYTLEFNGDTTDDGSTVYIQKDVVFSGSAKLDKLALWIGDSGKTKVAHVLFSEGSEFVINNTGALNGRYLSDGSAASTMTVDNASVKVNEFSMNGPLVINGNGTGKADASGNIYGFLKDGTYKENFIGSGMTVLDLANANNGMGLQLTDYAWVKTNGSNYLTLKDDKPTTVSIENSRLDVAGYIRFNADGGIIQISGDSVFTAGQLGYGSGSVVSKTGSINISGLDAEITVGQISSAVTAINFTLTAAEVGALTESYTLFELTDAAAAFDANTAISFKVDDKSYGVGEKFMIGNEGYRVALGGTDSNDLILSKLDPYMIDSQNFVTDTTLSGTDKAYYRNPDENYSGFSSIYNVGSGSTLTIAEGVAVDLERNASGTKSIILVGANDCFASQGFEATGAGNLVVNGTLDVGQLNAMADGTITVNGELNITTACIEKGSLIYNTGSTGLINCLNIFNNANATVTVNGLAAITLAGEPAHALKDNGAADIADRFIVNVTDADLAAMTGATHTILDVKSSSVSIADKFTVKVNGKAYTLGDTITNAAGDTYVINMGDADGDSTANDLILTNTTPPLTVSANGSAVGKYESLTDALAAINADAGTGPYTINFSRDVDVSATEKTRLDILKDVIFSGTAVYTTGTNCYLGSSDAGVNLTIAAGSDIELILSGEANLNARYSSTKTSTLTVDNARFRLSSYMSANGLITVKGDATSSDYGFKKGDEYVANFETRQITAFDKYGEANGVGLELTDRAYLRIAGGDNTGVGEFLRWKGDADTTVNITDSKLVAGAFSFAGSGKKHTLNIAGDSVVNVSYVGYEANVNTVSAASATINVMGMDSEISFGQISSAVTAINYTLKLADFASVGMIEAGDDVELFTLNNADAALDAATVLSITIDGAAYTLGDEIVDDAGNKYVINMGDANGDSAANDLLVTMTEKAPEPVIPEDPVLPEDPGSGGEGGEGGMEIAPQNPPVFINPKYSEKSTGKKVNGVELEYGVNAFSSIEDAKAALGADAAVSMVVNKSAKFDSESDLSGISEIAGNSPVEKSTVKSSPKKSLTLNGTTAAATGFRQFSSVKVLNGANIGGDLINEKYTIKFKGTKDANGAWLDGVATTTNSAAGTLKVTDSTIANVFGFKSVKLTNSQAGILGVNPVAKEVATIEGGAVASTEIVKEKRVGTVTAKDSIVDSVMDYKTLKLQGESAVASIVNVQSVSISGKADVLINDLTDTAILNNKLTVGSKAIVDLGIGNFGAGNDKMTIGSKATVYADSLDFGEGKDSLKISGTLVLENGMLEGIEKISGRGEIATTAAYADALDERYDDVFGGEILDLGNTVANFRGTKNELADNTEKKALKWDTADGELGGWLGIGDDVDCIDSVDFVKITASKDGTLEISSADWSGSSDIVTLDGVSLDITGGSASFGITAGEDYLLKIERKDNNSMSYDIKLA